MRKVVLPRRPCTLLMTHATFVPLVFQPHPAGEMRQRAAAFREQLRRRRTVRDFSSQAVDSEVIEDCLLAPAGGAPKRSQPATLALRGRERPSDQETDSRGSGKRGARVLPRPRAAGVARRAGPARHRRPEAVSRNRAVSDRDLRAELRRVAGRPQGQELLRSGISRHRDWHVDHRDPPCRSRLADAHTQPDGLSTTPFSTAHPTRNPICCSWSAIRPRAPSCRTSARSRSPRSPRSSSGGQPFPPGRRLTVCRFLTISLSLNR